MHAGLRTRAGAAAVAVTVAAAIGAPAAHAGKPAPPPPPPPPTGVVATGFSGQGTVANVNLSLLGQAIPPIVLGDTGPLPSNGGFVTSGPLLAIPPLGVAGLTLTGEAVSALTTGNGLESDSFASVAEVGVGVTPLALGVTAGVLQSSSHAACNPDGSASVSGSSTIADLTINGTPIVVSGAPNQTISVPGVASIIINEQITGPGSITVNALHVKVLPDAPLNLVASGDIVISSAHSDIACAVVPNPPPPSCTVRDFVTGGGQVTSGTDNHKVTFSTVAGVKSAGGYTGHLNVVDHGASGTHLQSHTVSAYGDPHPTSTQRDMVFALDGGGNAQVHVADNGEPGVNDVWSIAAPGYSAGSATTAITHGNIQLHQPKGCQPATPTSTKPPKGR
jgi:hypothetical protein